MRKSLKLALIGAAILGSLAIAGCGDNSKPSGASSTQESKLMQTIKQRGKLIVGTSSGYPPYVFVDADSLTRRSLGSILNCASRLLTNSVSRWKYRIWDSLRFFHQ